jgi:chromosome partition protein MukE
MMLIYMQPHFAEVDTALRTGFHVTANNFAEYEFIAQNFDALSGFYRSYHSTLTEHPDGFFYLQTDDNSTIPSRTLPRPCMHLGQLLALMARDPSITKTKGVVTTDHLFKTLGAMFSTTILGKIYAPHAKGMSTEEKIQKEIRRALRTLAQLNFIVLDKNEASLSMTVAINRFVEIARHDNEPSEAARRELEICRGVRFDAFDNSTFQEDENGEN